ncbi:MAG: hypothetical protein JNL58_26010 [Planctomyces sp.]|nr:hypothetical protein [Planctomyces sp.]
MGRWNPNRFLLVLCLAMLWCNGLTLGQQRRRDLPPNLLAVIERFGKESDQLKEQSDRKITEAAMTLGVRLEERMTELLTKQRLDEAQAVRKLLDGIRNAPTAQEMRKVIDLSGLTPAAGMHQHLLEFHKTVFESDVAFGEAYEPHREMFLKELASLGGLNHPEVRKLRNDVLGLVSFRKENVLPDLTDDSEVAGIIYKRTLAELKTKLRVELELEAIHLLAELQPLLESAAVAGDLEEAIAIREIGQEMIKASQPHVTAKVLMSTHEAKLGAAPMKLIDQFVEASDQSYREYFDTRAELNRRWSRFDGGSVASELKLGLGTLWEERDRLEKHFRLLGESPDWIQAAMLKSPPVGKPVATILRKLDREIAAALKVADRTDGGVRKKLIDSLSRLPDSPADSPAERSYKRLMKFLKADYSEGLRGTMLLTLDPDLSEEAKVLVVQYMTEATEARKVFRNEYEQILSVYRKEFEPLRRKFLDDGEFADAFSISVQLHHREYGLPPIWVKTCDEFLLDHPGSNAVDRLLLDVQGDMYLIINPEGRREDPKWLPRRQVFLTWEDFPADPSPVPARYRVLNLPEGLGGAPTARPIEENQRLKPGITVFGFTEHRWVEYKVLDVSPFGAVVGEKFFDVERTIVIPRSSLRMK